jgi:phosphoglycolate phosphatase-like HAD superfamily hydrolase
MGFLCWKRERVGKVLGVEAESLSLSVFLAVHHPLRAQVLNYREATRAGESSRLEKGTWLDQEQILTRFLDPAATLVFVPVLGDPGTGKSHLVRWLGNRISDTSKRKVVRVPRSTSLKGVLERILDGLDGDRFDEYRERLQKAASQPALETSKEILLNHLALYAGSNSPDPVQASNRDEQFVVDGIPHLLHDPHIRPFFLRSDGIIERLVRQALFENKESQGADDPAEFKESDLPLELVQMQNAAELSRKFLNRLRSTASVRAAGVSHLNRVFHGAARRLLDFQKSEDIRELIRDVRMELARQGMELVLLVEDFARVELIDKELLDVVIEDTGGDSGDPLCVMRTALAVTPGYYDRLMDTVKQRARPFHLLLGGDGHGIAGTDVLEFCARYLNALRTPPEELDAWAAENGARSHPEVLESQCGNCQLKIKCHDGFGAVGDVGLYPFTETSIRQMLTRVGPRTHPRVILRQVLTQILDQYAEALAADAFPPLSLAEEFKGPKLDLAVQLDIRRRDAKNAPRRIALLDLWSTANAPVNLRPSLHEMFALPPLEGPSPPQPAAAPHGVITTGPAAVPAIPAVPVVSDPRLDEIHEWSQRNGKLTQATTQRLRDIIFELVTAGVPWEVNHLDRGFFAGSRSENPFRKESVCFVDQVAAVRESAITLRIPLPEQDRQEVGVALQGLLRWDTATHWQFEGGGGAYRVVARLLDDWTDHILSQSLRAGTKDEAWDPVVAATSALALSQAILGQPVPPTGPAAQMEALFLSAPVSIAETRSKEWNGLAAELIKDRGRGRTWFVSVRESLLAHVTCPKGTGGALVVDAARLLDAVRVTVQAGSPIAPPPDPLPNAYQDLGKMWRALMERLPGAAGEEQERITAWAKKATARLGALEERVGLSDEVRRLTDDLEQAGCFPTTVERQQVGGVAPRIVATKSLDDLFSEALGLASIEKDGRQLFAIARNHETDRAEVEYFIDNVDRLLVGAFARATSVQQQLQATFAGSRLESARAGILTHLQELAAALDIVSGTGSATSESDAVGGEVVS